MARLAGKMALVTGSTRGIGRVIAETLADEGASLIVTGRQQADVARTVADLEATGATVVGFAADLADPAEAHRLAERALAAVPTLDILVNNAGMSLRESFWDVSDARWEEQVNV
jgi:NAD(P)-dependent dehydrogenase (short-subunit alcohol dehydrogenase family)